MSKKHNERLRREQKEIETLKAFNLNRKSLQDTKVRGRKKQRSRNEKLDRFQHNLTNGQSCKARATFNYFPGGLFNRPDMFIG